jgi:hypothetical protein
MAACACVVLISNDKRPNYRRMESYGIVLQFRRNRDRIPTRSRGRFWIMADVLRFSPWSDGNKIKDKYVAHMLVERRVNGFIEPVGQIQSDR